MKPSGLPFVCLLACLCWTGCASHHSSKSGAGAGQVTSTSSLQSYLNGSLKGAKIVVETTTQNTVLVLRGTVPKKREKKKASELAKKMTPGYRISNKIIVTR